MADYAMSFTVLDADGDESDRNWFFTAADDAAALTKIEAALETADDLILGKIIRATMTHEINISGFSLKASPAAGADKEIRAQFVFSTANPKVKPEITLPTFDRETFTSVGGNIPFDLGGSDPVDVFLVAMVDGNWGDYRYADFNGVLKAREIFS